jgi:hypothetical protein
MGMLPTASRSFAVTPAGAAIARTRPPMPIRELRRAEILHASARTQQSARSYTHIWRLSHDRIQLDQKKVAQLPPLRTTLLALDPEDPTSTTLELDERMARLSSKKRTTAGFGLPCAARRVKRWLMRLGIGAKRRVNACGRPFQRAIVLVTASRLSGQRIRRSSLRSSTQQWAKRREKPLTWSAGITPCGNDSPVLSA